MLTFQTPKDAQAAGYRIAVRGAIYHTYRGAEIIGADTNQARLRGLAFCLRVQIHESYTRNYLGVISDQHFGTTVTAQIIASGKDRMGGFVGSKAQNNQIYVFEPDVYGSAIAQAKEWTDRWFRYNPDALERHLLYQQNQRLLLGKCVA